MIRSLSQFATESARDIGCLRAGQTLSTDILADIQGACNEMLDSWLLDELLVLTYPAIQYQLTGGISNYVVGPGATGSYTIDGIEYLGLDAARPTGIEDANIILNTVSPVLRTPLELINKDQYADIRIQQIPAALPLKLYYDNNFNAVNVGSGWGTFNLWPGPLDSYLLECFTWDQTVLREFPDAVTGFSYPPGYARLIRKGLAVEIVPLMAMYCKAARIEHLMMPVAAQIELVRQQFEDAKDKVASNNQTDPILVGDPAYQGSQQARGGFNYLDGLNGRSGR